MHGDGDEDCQSPSYLIPRAVGFVDSDSIVYKKPSIHLINAEEERWRSFTSNNDAWAKLES